MNNYINLKNNFINNYHIDEYKIIFTDGSKKKNLKSSDNYIANNQLETILQKCFLNDIINKLDLNDCYYYNITETHGNANLSIIFNSFKDISEDKVDFDFAFQNGTFKLAVSKEYWEKKNLKKNVAIIKRWEEHFRKVSSEAMTRVNISNKNKRPRISMSWQFPCEGDWYRTKPDKMIETFKEQINKSKQLQQRILAEFSNNK